MVDFSWRPGANFVYSAANKPRVRLILPSFRPLHPMPVLMFQPLVVDKPFHTQHTTWLWCPSPPFDSSNWIWNITSADHNIILCLEGLQQCSRVVRNWTGNMNTEVGRLSTKCDKLDCLMLLLLLLLVPFASPQELHRIQVFECGWNPIVFFFDRK